MGYETTLFVEVDHSRRDKLLKHLRLGRHSKKKVPYATRGVLIEHVSGRGNGARVDSNAGPIPLSLDA